MLFRCFVQANIRYFGGIKEGAVSAATPDSEKAENTDEPSVSDEASDNYSGSKPSSASSQGSGEGFPVKTVIILAAVLIGLIAVEVFIYKIVKLNRSK